MYNNTYGHTHTHTYIYIYVAILTAVLWDCLTQEDRNDRLSQKVKTNYQSALHKVPEESRSEQTSHEWWSVLKPLFLGRDAVWFFFFWGGGRLSYIFVFRIEEAGFYETSVRMSIYQTKGPHIPEDCNIKDNAIKKID